MAKKDALALGYDLGGTKVALGVINSEGRVLKEKRTAVKINQGKDFVVQQLADLGLEMMSEFPEIQSVGLASAGPLDSNRGVLLDPTNFFSDGESWGEVAIVDLLSKKIGLPVRLENDAAAAALAEQWIGTTRGIKNSVTLTLGTGLGTGIICNNALVRGGRDLHPEAGHIILKKGDQTAPCGCGNLGCAEALLSGRSFTRRSRTRFADPKLTAVDIANLARKKDPRALAAFAEYSELMAAAIRSYIVLYYPEIVVLTGSFAATADLFLEQTRVELEKLMTRRRVGIDLMPELKVSQLDNKAGVIGAGYVALFGASIEKR